MIDFSKKPCCPIKNIERHIEFIEKGLVLLRIYKVAPSVYLIFIKTACCP
jgi:hypothetical protein